MYELALYAFLSALVVSVVSLIGIASFSLNQTRLQKATNLLVSLAAGAMLGNALLHLLPHSLEYAQEHKAAIVHQHSPAPGAAHVHDEADSQKPDHHTEAEHEHHDHDSAIHEHEHEEDHDHVGTAASAQPEEHSHEHPGLGVAALILAGLLGMLAFDFALLSYGRGSDNSVKPAAYLVLLSDGLENFLDGLVIGTAYLISVPLGIATTMAVFAHEIPIEMGDFAVLTKSGFSRKKALLLNFLSGLVSLVGVAVALFAGSFVPGFAMYATPLAAGAFLYLAGAVLLPQIREEGTRSDKFVSFLMILLGVAVMALLLLIE